MNNKRNNSSIHNFKKERLDSEFVKELNVILQDVKDKRVDPLTDVVSVQLSKDLSYCKAFIKTEAKDKKLVIEGLNAAKNFIKMQLVINLNLRRTPELVFEYDDTIDKATHIEELLKEIHDKEKLNSK